MLNKKKLPSPIDELAIVREQIRLLKEDEKALRGQVATFFTMPSVDRVIGNDYIAILRVVSRKGALDEALIKEALDVDDLDGFREPATDVVSIKTEGLS